VINKSEGVGFLRSAIRYVFSPTSPIGSKLFIVATLLYFLSPIDLIPDFIPAAGYADDLAAVLIAIVVNIISAQEAARQSKEEK
jgi:uncharacterized membrane protein YkvA (DUF1232 family)